jgi:hypothetical protein
MEFASMIQTDFLLVGEAASPSAEVLALAFGLMEDFLGATNREDFLGGSRSLVVVTTVSLLVVIAKSAIFSIRSPSMLFKLWRCTSKAFSKRSGLLRVSPAVRGLPVFPSMPDARLEPGLASDARLEPDRSLAVERSLSRPLLRLGGRLARWLLLLFLLALLSMLLVCPNACSMSLFNSPSADCCSSTSAAASAARLSCLSKSMSICRTMSGSPMLAVIFMCSLLECAGTTGNKDSSLSGTTRDLEQIGDK